MIIRVISAKLLNSVTVEDFKVFISSENLLRHKVYGKSCEANDDLIEEEEDEVMISEFLDALYRGRLTLPRLSTINFAHACHVLYQRTQIKCIRHLANVFFL